MDARRWMIAAGLVALALPAAAQPQPSTADLEALFWARQQEATDRFVQADVDFMTGMIGHHAQALIMADLAPTNGARPAVQRLAARIINAQRDEIALMQRWLADRGQPVPHVHIDGTVMTVMMVSADHHNAMHPNGPAIRMGGPGEGHAGMDHGQMDHGQMDHGQMDHGQMDHGQMDHSRMAGMLTQAQLDELAAARGTHFDRLFLRYMIGHHAGAVTMVDTLFAADGAAQGGNTFKVASDIQVDQRTEIARMQQMLDALPQTD